MGNTISHDDDGAARRDTLQSPSQVARKRRVESPIEKRMREASGPNARTPTDTPESSSVDNYEALLHGLIMKNGTCMYNEERARSAATAEALSKLSDRPGVAPSIQRSEALAQAAHAGPLADQGARAKDTIRAALATLYAEETRANEQLRVIHDEIVALTAQWRTSITNGDGAATKAAKSNLERAIRRYRGLESMIDGKIMHTNMMQAHLVEVETFMSNVTSSAMVEHVHKHMPDIAVASRLATEFSKASKALDDRTQEMRRASDRINTAVNVTGLDTSHGGVGQRMADDDIMAELDAILGVTPGSDGEGEDEAHGLDFVEVPLGGPSSRELAADMPSVVFTRPGTDNAHAEMPDAPSARPTTSRPRAPAQTAS